MEALTTEAQRHRESLDILVYMPIQSDWIAEVGKARGAEKHSIPGVCEHLSTAATMPVSASRQIGRYVEVVNENVGNT